MFTSKLRISCRYQILKQISKRKYCHESPDQGKPRVKLFAQLVPEVEAELEAGNIKHRKYPGIRKHKTITLPEKLLSAIDKALPEHDLPNLVERSKELDKLLYLRRLPPETEELKNKALDFMKKMNLSPEDFESTESAKKNTALLNRKLRFESNRWKPIDYNSHVCLLYLISRLAPIYASTYQVFSEIVTSLPSLQPKTFFDFGSGVGSAVWAANEFWGSNIKEYFCVDSSADMNTLSEHLLRGGDMDSPMLINKVFFRQFLPASNERMYDLVVSSFSLMDMHSLEDRLRVIDILWQKTSDIMVIIENGSKAGFSAVLEARDYILKFEEEFNPHESRGAHVIAPCPHELPCPKFGLPKYPCHFPVTFHPFLPKKDSSSVKKDLYTYVVLRKGKKDSSVKSWPRVIAPVLLRKKMAICRMCCNDGQMHEIIFSKGKYSANAYKCAKYSSQGDCMPFTITEKQVDSDETCEQLSSELK